MKTKIKTAHEESYTNGDKTLGVLINYPLDIYEDVTNDDIDPFSKINTTFTRDSFIYVYKEGMYIFFDTIVSMIDYLLYGDAKMRRAYMEEVEFDEYWDAEFIDGKFTDILKWI